jgi:hypothetical protein
VIADLHALFDQPGQILPIEHATATDAGGVDEQRCRHTEFLQQGHGARTKGVVSIVDGEHRCRCVEVTGIKSLQGVTQC